MNNAKPTSAAAPAKKMPTHDEEDVYEYLVVDSGPIIRITGMSTLWKRARKFYTVPAVLQEIRDAKARQHLDSLPFELTAREPSPEGVHAVIEFARLTGDYQSLSSVDLQVLGLLYDLEREGCGDMSHVRKTPKRTIGLGKIESLGKGEAKRVQPTPASLEGGSVVEPGSSPIAHEEEKQVEPEPTLAPVPVSSTEKPKTWATLVNPSAATSAPSDDSEQKIANKALSVTFGQMNLSKDVETTQDLGGQFSDAEDEKSSESDSDYDPEGDLSDEDCDVYIMDPEEADERKQAANGDNATEELQSEFPSLAASLLVPYEGDSDNETEDEMDEEAAAIKAEEERKQKALEPISNSGKHYNSFRKYGKLMKPAPAAKKAPTAADTPAVEEPTVEASVTDTWNEMDKNQSRIIGGMAFSGQGGDVEDDGEGWITSTKDIRTMKAAGALDPMQDPKNIDKNALARKPLGPPISQRAACATTDFAMQNVILQMNLELLSVDGMKVRKLKSWVTRCGACFKVYTSSENAGPLGSKRLFCDHCGSDMMQRIAASVDGKTGRLRLHLAKNYKHNLRGTKFSLPKPGSGNRFQGDLLLREDQLLTGVWNQKVKMRSGGKSRNDAQSMFGRDIAGNVGCHASAVNHDDIRVGFGRRNPNSAKGRERRGKKKKSTDKACGLRRY